MALAAAGDLPFQQRAVRQWSRLDPRTGAREAARRETDAWSAPGARYGKVSDHVAREAPGVSQRSHKQLEVFQSKGPGGSVQVVRQTVSSSSRSSTTTGFDNIQLNLNHLDLTSQKAKVSVGRSGSIGGRRPPSRPRSIIEKPSGVITEDAGKNEVENRLTEVSRICQRIHDDVASSRGFGSSSVFGNSGLFITEDSTSNRDIQDDLEIEVSPKLVELVDSSTDPENDYTAADNPGGTKNYLGVRNSFTERNNRLTGSAHNIINRRKSSSTEDLHSSLTDTGNQVDDSAEEDCEWKRSNVRRSLPYSSKNPTDLPPTGSVSKLRKELEGRTFDRRSENDESSIFDAVENILRHNSDVLEKINNDRKTLDKESARSSPSKDFELEGFSRRAHSTSKGSPNKRHSIVTVESLKEGRDRLKRLNSPPVDDIHQPEQPKQPETKNILDCDDGIVTEDSTRNLSIDSTLEMTPSKVRAYVFGMESRNVSRKAIPGTGSLESRSSNKSNSSGSSRNEEWYNRRKSYGFEQVHNQQAVEQPSLMKFREKNKVESSTDSGICKSSETVIVPSWTKPARTMPDEVNTHYYPGTNDHEGLLKTVHSINIKNTQNNRDKNIDTRTRDTTTQKGRTTVVTLGNANDMMGAKNAIRNGNTDDVRHHAADSFSSSLCATDSKRLTEPVTIKIPIVPEEDRLPNKTGSVENRRLFFQQLSEGNSVDRSWKKSPTVMRGNTVSNDLVQSPTKMGEPSKTGGTYEANRWSRSTRLIENDMKRHSIAVDESKYVRNGIRSYNTVCCEDQPHFNENISRNDNPEKNRITFAVNKENHCDSPPVPSNNGGLTGEENSDPTCFDDENDEYLQNQSGGKKHKKVEFCKTEVHFAAEPGRFNLVETDEKPPPTNMFRRRRRHSTAAAITNQAVDPSKGNLPQLRFGDSAYEKQLLASAEDSIQQTRELHNNQEKLVASTQTTPPVPRPKMLSRHAFQDVADKEDIVFTESNATIVPALQNTESGGDEDDEMTIQNHRMECHDDSKPRSILKNYKKPRPFHLGEETELVPTQTVENTESKWGVKLRSLQENKESASVWKSSIIVRNKTFETPHSGSTSEECKSDDGGVELQKMLRSLRPASRRTSDNDSESPQAKPSSFSRTNSSLQTQGGIDVRISSSTTVTRQPTWSVADRIRQVEHKVTGSKGYSTRVNMEGGEATVLESSRQENKQIIVAEIPPSQQAAAKHEWRQQEERPHGASTVFGTGYLEGSGVVVHDTAPETRQCAVATAVLPSYTDSGRLKAVETLVSTRTGHPKITSISLRYEGDQDNHHEAPSPFKPSAQAYPQEAKSDLYNVKSAVTGQHVYFGHSSSNLSPKLTKSSSSSSVGSHSVIRTQVTSLTDRSTSDHQKPFSSQTYTLEQPSKYCDIKYEPERQAAKYHADQAQLSPRATKLQTTEQSDLVEYKSSKFPRSRSTQRSHSPTENQPSPNAPRRSPSPSARNVKKYSHQSCETVQSACGNSVRSTDPTPSRLYTKNDRYRRSEASSYSSSAVKTWEDGSQQQSASVEDKHSLIVNGTSKATNHNKKVDSHYQKLSAGKSGAGNKFSDKPSNRNKVHSDISNSKYVADQTRPESPVYENREVFKNMTAQKPRSKNGIDHVESESAILEELTRAADQILQAVNGYTDEESYRASSEDNDHEASGRRRRRRTVAVTKSTADLGTISEAPPARKQGSSKTAKDPAQQKTNGNVRRTQRLSKTRLGPTSSTSSIESYTREVRKPSSSQSRNVAKQEKSNTLDSGTSRKLNTDSAPSGNKPLSRSARLLQRASSRELLLQAHASSSEDVMSGVESANVRKPRAPRKPRSSNKKTGTPTATTSVSKKQVDTHINSTSGIKGGGKETSETLKSKDRYAVPAAKTNSSTRKSSTGVEGSSSISRPDLKTSSRTRSSRPREEEGYRRSRMTAGGVAVKEKSERATPERRLTTVPATRSPTVVMKKKQVSSRSDRIPHIKPTKQ